MPSPRGHSLVAWLVIGAVITFVAVRPRPADRASRHAAFVLEGRALVGLGRLGWPGLTPQKVYQQNREALEQGAADQRLRFATVVGELAGAAAAEKQLAPIAEEREQPESDLARLLMRNYAGRPLSDADCEELKQRLGWFAELALATDKADPDGRARVLAGARRAAVVRFALGVGLFGGALVGLAVLVVLCVLALTGRLGGGLAASGNGGIYAETFALYLLLFLGLGLAARYGWGGPPLLMNGAVMFASLAALLWPVLRGVPWAQVCRDVGLFAGRRPALEPFFGVACYLATLPLVLGMFIVTVVGAALWRRLSGAEMPPPDHPLIGLVLRGDAWVWVQVALVACVAAPVVEETMFRGVLFRHLREAIPGGTLAMLLAALASAVVFAVVHPQGVLGVPVLSALALGFALAREWRGTLLPSMVAHSVNNATVTVALLLALA
jgi:membrane protease YdiL (CAAX protease family)